VRAPIAGKRTHTAGTPSYMAPELVVGDLGKTDARTDVYLLGATLHHALTGCARHGGETVYQALHAANASAPYDYGAEVPGELAVILNRAMSREPSQRFESALALRRAFAEFLRHRGSIAMSDEASARLDELGAAVAATDDERRVHALMIECRFGFTQALSAWADNRSAKEGLARTLEVSIAHEIGRRDAPRARDLLAELEAPSPALVARVEALEAALAREAVEHDRLRAGERDRDLRVGGATQLAVLAVLPALAAAIAAYMLTRHRVLTPPEVIAAPAVATVLLVAGALLARRRLVTSASRRAIAAIALLPIGAAVHRAVGLSFGDALPSMLASDLVLGAVVALILAITLARRVAWVAVPCGLGAAAITLWPTIGLPLFSAATGSAIGLLWVVWRSVVRPLDMK